MQSKIIYLVILVFLGVGATVSPIYGQNAYLRGYYLNLQGDTLHGFVKIQSRKASTFQCLFKAEKKGKGKKLTPENIKGYGFEGGKVFLKRAIKDSSQQVSQVFMELLLTGRLKLFQLEQRFFLEYGDGQFEELISSEKNVNTGYRVYKKTGHEYLEVLGRAMEDCRTVLIPISSGQRSLELNQKRLMQLIKDYHACFQEEIVQPDPRPAVRLSFASVLGVGRSSLHYKVSPSFKSFGSGANTNSAIYSLVNTEYTVSQSPLIGAFMSVRFPRSQSGLSIRAELLFQSMGFRGQNEFAVPNNQFNDPHEISDELEIRLQKISLPIGFIKSIGGYNSLFYIGAGFDLQFNVARKYVILREMQFENSLRPFVNTERLDEQRSLELGVWAKAGVVLAKSSQNQLMLEFKVARLGRKNRFYDYNFGGRIMKTRYRIQSVSVNLAYEFGT